MLIMQRNKAAFVHTKFRIFINSNRILPDQDKQANFTDSFLGISFVSQCNSITLWIQPWPPHGPGSQDTKYFWMGNL